MAAVRAAAYAKVNDLFPQEPLMGYGEGACHYWRPVGIVDQPDGVYLQVVHATSGPPLPKGPEHKQALALTWKEVDALLEEGEEGEEGEEVDGGARDAEAA